VNALANFVITSIFTNVSRNFEQELGQSNKEIIRLNSDLASVQTSNQALQEELNAFKKLVNAAKAEIQVRFLIWSNNL